MTYQSDYLKSKYGTESLNNSRLSRVRASRKRDIIKVTNYKLRKRLFVGVILAALFLLVFWQPISDSSTVIFSSASAEIKKVGQDAGLNMHGQAIFLSNNPEFANANTLASICPHEQEVIEFGCYLPSTNKIYILKVNDDKLQSIELTAVAHEMLHAVWDNLDASKQQSISAALTSFYNSKSSDTLTTDAEPYVKDATPDFVSELHSLSGSEIGESVMPSAMREHFDQYFTTQSSSVGAKSTFDSNIEDQIKDLNNRKNQLDADNNALDDFKAEYLDGIKAYMQSNLYYGDIFTYNKNVDAYNQNLQIYKDKVNQYNSDVESYNFDRQKFVDAYSALFPSKLIPVGDAK